MPVGLTATLSWPILYILVNARSSPTILVNMDGQDRAGSCISCLSVLIPS